MQEQKQDGEGKWVWKMNINKFECIWIYVHRKYEFLGIALHWIISMENKKNTQGDFLDYLENEKLRLIKFSRKIDSFEINVIRHH